MASESERIARTIEKALEGLPDAERRRAVRYFVKSWLEGGRGWSSGGPPSPLDAVLGSAAGAYVVSPGVNPIALAAGEQQTFLVRLPEVQHEELKSWCAEHGFSMATVVRGLVESFLRTQDSGSRPLPEEPDAS